MGNNISYMKKGDFNNHLITQSLSHLIANILRNVTKIIKNRQLLNVTCFIIYVGLDCIGVEAYA